MEPAPYGSPYAQDQSAWNAPPSGAQPPARPGARIGLIVLVAVVTALLLIAAGANQWATEQMRKTSGQARFYLDGWLTYAWRVTGDNQPARYWAAQWALIGTVLVLTAALVWCLLRGPVSWGRAFFGTWLAVVFATVVGSVVRALVLPDRFTTLPGANRVTSALFGPFGPNSAAVFGGLALGFVVALLTSLVAVVSRRSPKPAPVTEPGPPSFPDYAAPAPSVPAAAPPWQDQHFGPPAGAQRPAEAAAATTALPRVPEDAPPSGEQPTTRLAPATEGEPSSPPPPPSSPPPPPPGDQATTRFPRPPDDEELGHIDH